MPDGQGASDAGFSGVASSPVPDRLGADGTQRRSPTCPGRTGVGLACAAAARRRFRDCALAAGDFLWESDAELRLRYLSRSAGATLGLPVALLLGRRLPELGLVPARAESTGWALVAAQPGPARFVPGAVFRDLRWPYTDPSGRIRTIEWSGVPVRAARGLLEAYRGVGRDVTERARAEERLRFLAGYDPLTGAGNRALLAATLAGLGRRLASESGRAGLFVIDLDGFKRINDRHGHTAGDAVLCALVRRLRESVAADDLVARLGGDEFAVLLGGIRHREELAARAAAIGRRLAEPIRAGGGCFMLRVSCGFALWPDDGSTFEVLLRRADEAMYRVKHAARGGARTERGRPEQVPAPG